MIKKVVLPDEKEAVKWTLISESKCDKLDNLLEIYKQDKRKAKIIFENTKSSASYMVTRIVLFEFSNGDFNICKMNRKFGMSVNAIIYNRENTEWAIGYKHKTKRVYLTRKINGRAVAMTQPCLNTINGILFNYSDKYSDQVYVELLKKFGWLRNVMEDKRCYALSFSTIMTKKLFNTKKMLSHIYNVPYPVAVILADVKNGYNQYDFLKVWKQMLRNLINVENLKPELLNHHLFMDACKMAGTLGKKINCSWSVKRLKEEHDKWSKEINDVIMEFEPIIDLNVRQVYLDFATFSGYKVLRTNHELISEGRIMRHCVGTYGNNVSGGHSAIYCLDGHTLELNYKTQRYTDKERRLSVGQLKGVGNAPAPTELTTEVNNFVDEFNRLFGNRIYQENCTSNLFDAELIDVLPF